MMTTTYTFGSENDLIEKVNSQICYFTVDGSSSKKIDAAIKEVASEIAKTTQTELSLNTIVITKLYDKRSTSQERMIAWAGKIVEFFKKSAESSK